MEKGKRIGRKGRRRGRKEREKRENGKGMALREGLIRNGA